MIEKKLTDSGQKAYQREDNEDRSLGYKNWLRTIKDSNGFPLDVDMIKWKNKDGKFVPTAITEITRCDSESVGKGYLDAITQRFFVRDSQGKVIRELSKLLNVPAYLILYQKDMLWMWVYSFQKDGWKLFSPDQWAEYWKGL